MARATASVRLETPSLESILLTWNLTVRTADNQRIGDFRVVEPISHQLKDLLFTVGEVKTGFVGGEAAGFDEDLGGLRGDRGGSSHMRRADGVRQFVGSLHF